MAGNKTVRTDASVRDFVAAIDNELRAGEAATLLNMMSNITDLKPSLWGDSIVGFGEYHYKYASGRQGDFFLTGFSPRKSAMTIYIIPGFRQYQPLLDRLGKHKHSVSCLYINKLETIDQQVLGELIATSVEDMKKAYPAWKP